MKPIRTLSALAMPLLVACVTINVYFPAAAAEKAADRFIQDVYGKQPSGTAAPQTPKTEPRNQGSQPNSGAADTDHLFAATLDFFISPARAAENIDINTPTIETIKRSMAQRNAEMRPFFASGAIGLTADGLVAVRDLGAVALAQRNRLRQLVAAENRDRNALYPEIAKANGHPEWEARMRQVWAKRWIANAPSGWWYQDSHGKWLRK